MFFKLKRAENGDKTLIKTCLNKKLNLKNQSEHANKLIFNFKFNQIQNGPQLSRFLTWGHIRIFDHWKMVGAEASFSILVLITNNKVRLEM